MAELWLDVTDLPAGGREFLFSDPELWAGPIRDFKLSCRQDPDKTPLEAAFRIQPEGRGYLIRGHLAGSVLTACDRCAEETALNLDASYELFEEPPATGGESLEPGLIRRRGKVIELDVAGLLWEQFVLALPVKPLCSDICQGVCPGCGINLNLDRCVCVEEGGDPRLAALKGLSIANKRDN